MSGVEAAVPGTDGPAHGAAQGGLPFVSLRPGGPAGPLVEALLAAYDLDRDGKLTAREAGLDAAAFRRLDRDGDGKLDKAELAAWADSPPDVSVTVPLGDSPAAPVEALPGSAPGVVVRPEREGVGLIFGDHAVAVRRAGGGSTPPAPALATTASVFRSLDRNGDGFLESKELHRPPFSHVAWLRLADRDGDGRISRKEFDAFLALQPRLRGATTFMRVDSEGRSLFRLLDADGDGSLGPREVRAAWERVSPWFDGRKGALAAGEVPRQFRVTIAHGSGPEAGPGRPPPRGPLWFRKMDRNRDGDVSLQEWLGSSEQFSEIDTDGDGLISPEEADRADRKSRTAR
jgi:Ca2+-binding EF-hand superfamily protein